MKVVYALRKDKITPSSTLSNSYFKAKKVRCHCFVWTSFSHLFYMSYAWTHGICAPAWGLQVVDMSFSRLLVASLLTGWKAIGRRHTIWAGAVSCYAAVAPADGGCA